MSCALTTWLRSLGLLRHAEVRAVLGDLCRRRRLADDLRRSYPDVKLVDSIEWIGYARERLDVGRDSCIEHGTIMAMGDVVSGYGHIRIGQRTWIGPYNNLRASRDADIHVGDDVLISQFCSLIGANHGTRQGVPIRCQPSATARIGVVLGNDVWLGAGVTVLPGTTIEDGAVIGANSVVGGVVPRNEIWAGSPARKIGVRQQAG